MNLPPITLGREGKWFVAACRSPDLATQGKTRKEAKDNLLDLINEYRMERRIGQ